MRHVLSPLRIINYLSRGAPAPTVEDYDLRPEADRLVYNPIQVTYTYAQEDEATATVSREAFSALTWDEDAEEVIREGDLPSLP